MPHTRESFRPTRRKDFSFVSLGDVGISLYLCIVKKLFIMMCLTAALTACSSDDDNDLLRPQTVEHTVIVYMSGENSLTGYVNADLREMKEGSRLIGEGNALIVYVDKSSNKELPWLARIKDGQVTDSVSLRDMGISDKDELSSDPHVFEDVLQYAVRHYPATRDYGLVLWGHSSGWLMKDSVAYTRAYGVDNGRNDVNSNEGKWLNLPTMARVLQKLPHLKFILADCCNFMCLESLYELRNVTDYIIGSPAEIPAIGAPYDKVVPTLFLQDDNFYTAIVDRYYEQKYKELDQPLSVVKTCEMEHVAQATRAALKAVNDSLGSNYADLTGLIYYRYIDANYFYKPYYTFFYDAGDFMLRYAPAAVYRQWKDALDSAIVYRRMSTHWDTFMKWDTFYGNRFTVTEERYHGVSMFVPQSPFSGNYVVYNQEIKSLAWYYAVLN